ncbi:MAG: hypothetical protein HYR56_06595 [Acidobacteria bacterium]|nr:hypothetical protein [Acidobacteriota bacterium]MBI3426692.1 hypothetical protein [Acidobacteriota bacterium]
MPRNSVAARARLEHLIPATGNLPAVIGKVFAPSTTPVNGMTTLTFTITNPATNPVALTGVGFTDTFPNALNLVVANPPNPVIMNCGGGAALTNDSNDLLVAGAPGIRLSGATVAIGAPCTVRVNVTPVAPGPFNNVSGNVMAANSGAGNTATATLLTNTPPTISSNTLVVKAGGNAASFTSATALDPDQSVNTLGITINGNPTTASSNGVTVSGVTITPAGAVTAQIATTCAAPNAPFTFVFVVTDNQTTTGTGTLTVTVPTNTPPLLSYSNQAMTAGTTARVRRTWRFGAAPMARGTSGKARRMITASCNGAPWAIKRVRAITTVMARRM